MKTINKLDPDIALNRILKLQNFRLQSNYELRDLLNIFVLSWRCGDTHKYISLGISDSDAIKENAGDNIIQMLGEGLGKQLSAPTANTRFGKWLVKKICKRL